MHEVKPSSTHKNTLVAHGFGGLRETAFDPSKPGSRTKVEASIRLGDTERLWPDKPPLRLVLGMVNSQPYVHLRRPNGDILSKGIDPYTFVPPEAIDALRCWFEKYCEEVHES